MTNPLMLDDPSLIGLHIFLIIGIVLSLIAACWLEKSNKLLRQKNQRRDARLRL